MPGLSWFFARGLEQLRFRFLQAFVLDKEMSCIEVEAYYQELLGCGLVLVNGVPLVLAGHIFRSDSTTNKQNYISKPLSELRKMFTTPEQVKFLNEQVVASTGLIFSLASSFSMHLLTILPC